MMVLTHSNELVAVVATQLTDLSKDGGSQTTPYLDPPIASPQLPAAKYA